MNQSPSSPSVLDETMDDSSSDEAYIVEIDDDTDEDNMATLLDKEAPDGLKILKSKIYFFLGISFFHCHTDVLQNTTSNLQNIILKKIFTIKSNDKLNQTISSFYHDIYASLCFSMNLFSPCTLNGIHTETQFKSDNMVEITISGMSLVTTEDVDSDDDSEEKLKSLNIPQLLPTNLPTPSPRVRKTPELMFEIDGEELNKQDEFVLTKNEEDLVIKICN